ncbi:hypothetical protein M513_13646 [Trichuris suis]|uniref:Uncharacterized protein n=1 Tax=Trichuris suis TaxID=68888 RepID=A0A085LKI2_9BILA|nr:hypothetical protein M513_13646 [Trichuris suis]
MATDLLDNINEDKTSESNVYYSVTFSSALILVIIRQFINLIFEKPFSVFEASVLPLMKNSVTISCVDFNWILPRYDPIQYFFYGKIHRLA